MTPDVISVKALPDFLLEAEFDDGEVRRFDMRPYLAYPAFAELRENALFMRATVVNGTVIWTDEIDLSPDTLYLRGTRVDVTASPPFTLYLEAFPIPVVIQVENLSKDDRLGLIGGGTLREDLNRWWAKARGRPDPLLKIDETDPGNPVVSALWARQDLVLTADHCP